MGEAAIGWLVLGVALHLANQVLRGRGWCALVRAAAGDDGAPRRRDAIAAWVAGAGAGGLVSARGGDAVRVLLLRRRMPEAGCPMLAGTLVAEGAGECATGALLIAIALVVGVGPAARRVDRDGRLRWSLRWCSRAVLIAVARRSARVRRIAAGVGRGCAPLRAPGAYARRVLPWQLASRACRLGALACFLTAFGAARHADRGAAGRVRAGREPDAAVRSRLGRRRRRAAGGELRPGHRQRRLGRAAGRVLHRHEHAADGRRHRAGAGDLPARSDLGERRPQLGRARSPAPGGGCWPAWRPCRRRSRRRSRRALRRCRTRSGCRWRPPRARSPGPTAARPCGRPGCRSAAASAIPTTTAKPTCRLGTAASSL